MPELPEVETVVRDLRAEVEGRSVVAVPHAASSVFRYPSPEALAAALPGASFAAVRRSGKYIHCVLARDGAAEVESEALIVHLGMTGHLEVCDAAAPERPHTHLRALLDRTRCAPRDSSPHSGSSRSARSSPCSGSTPCCGGPPGR